MKLWVLTLRVDGKRQPLYSPTYTDRAAAQLTADRSNQRDPRVVFIVERKLEP